MSITKSTLVVGIFLSLARLASAQAPTGRPYDGIDAGVDAYNRAEEQRQFKISQQRALNEDLRARSYIPPGAYAYGPTAEFGYSSFGYPGYGYSSYSYSNYGLGGFRTRVGRYQEQVVARPVVSLYVSPNRYIGINSYTYPFKLPVRQPIGQQQVQTGPNRWESHPIYGEPLPRYPVTPPVANDPLELRGPPGTVAVPPPPAPPPATGPAPSPGITSSPGIAPSPGPGIAPTPATPFRLGPAPPRSPREF